MADAIGVTTKENGPPNAWCGPDKGFIFLVQSSDKQLAALKKQVLNARREARTAPPEDVVTGLIQMTFR